MSSSGDDADLLLRIDCVRLLAILSLKMAVKEATNSFFGLASPKKIRFEVGLVVTVGLNLSERFGLAPPDPRLLADSGSSNAELQARNVTPC